jgi:SAM-dependent methyltransferase
MDLATVLERLKKLPPSTWRDPDAKSGIEARLPSTKREAERLLWREGLARAFGNDRPIAGLALDAGCGEGDYLPDLAASFTHVVAVDADARRMQRVHEKLPSVPAFALRPQDALAELAGELRFAQSLQVLGHLTCADAQAVGQALARSLGAGGAALIAVPYTNVFADDFRLSELASTDSRVLSREQYDALVADPKPGSLPVRHFTMPSIVALLEAAGLREEWTCPYGWLSYEHADLMVLARRR